MDMRNVKAIKVAGKDIKKVMNSGKVVWEEYIEDDGLTKFQIKSIETPHSGAIKVNLQDVTNLRNKDGKSCLKVILKFNESMLMNEQMPITILGTLSGAKLIWPLKTTTVKTKFLRDFVELFDHAGDSAPDFTYTKLGVGHYQFYRKSNTTVVHLKDYAINIFTNNTLTEKQIRDYVKSLNFRYEGI